MAENKTKQTELSVKKFIDAIADEHKRADTFAITAMIKSATRLEPKMWGSSIIGFGSVHYKYDSGREGDICKMGFSPRKSNFAFYLPGGHPAYAGELKKLGKHKTAKGCFYINQLAEVDKTVLQKIFDQAAKSK